MIAVTTPKDKKLSLDVIAVTPEGEKAYYVPPDVMRPTDEDLGQVGISPSKSEWYPAVTQAHRLTAFLAGNPGAGKSYLAADLIKMLPKSADILLFTALDETDGNFEKLPQKIWKISLEPEKLEKLLELKNIRAMSKCPILLFDDIDKIPDTGIRKLVFAIMENALANGRGHRKHDGEGDIHVIATSHALNDFLKTKYMFENSDHVCLFPQSTPYLQMKRMFDKIGLKKDLLDNVIKMGKMDGIRRVIIRKIHPMYLIAGPNITLLT